MRLSDQFGLFTGALSLLVALCFPCVKTGDLDPDKLNAPRATWF